MNAKGKLTFDEKNAVWPAERAAAKKQAEEEAQPEEAQKGQKGGIAGQEGEEGEKKEGEGDEDQQLVNKLVEKLQPEKKSEDQKIDELVKKSGQVLLKLSGIFPLDLLPDELTIDTTKVSIAVHSFLGGSQIYSIPTKQLQDVAVEFTPFTATLKIIDKRYKDQPITIKHLKKSEAVTARQLIQGLIISTEQKIDVSKLKEPGKETAAKIEKLGKARQIE